MSNAVEKKVEVEKKDADVKTNETCSYFKLYSQADRFDYLLIFAVS